VWDCGGYGGGASGTEVQARAVLAAYDCVVSSSLHSLVQSHLLQFHFLSNFPPSVLHDVAFEFVTDREVPHVDEGTVETEDPDGKG